MIRCIVGLGNPGVNYENTRHNIGFRVVDALAEDAACTWKKHWWQNYWFSQFGEPYKIICAKPATYMNISGKAVSSIVKKYKLSLDELLIVYDDVHLPPGNLRFRMRGSSGGHNGLSSVINWLGTEEIPRLRLGIGEGSGDRTDHVLSDFTTDERDVAESLVSNAVKAISILFSTPIEAAMQQINALNV